MIRVCLNQLKTASWSRGESNESRDLDIRWGMDMLRLGKKQAEQRYATASVNSVCVRSAAERQTPICAARQNHLLKMLKMLISDLCYKS